MKGGRGRWRRGRVCSCRQDATYCTRRVALKTRCIRLKNLICDSAVGRRCRPATRPAAQKPQAAGFPFGPSLDVCSAVGSTTV